MTAPTLNQNLFQPQKFQVMFDRLPNTVFYVTKTTVPGITISEAVQATPLTMLRVPGTKTDFDPWTFTFVLDANMVSWFAVYNWLTGLGMPQSTDQYAALANNAITKPGTAPRIGVRPPYSDATLTVYDPNNNPNKKFMFKDCYPLGLSGVDLGYEQSAQDTVTCTTKFRYSYFTFENLA